MTFKYAVRASMNLNEHQIKSGDLQIWSYGIKWVWRTFKYHQMTFKYTVMASNELKDPSNNVKWYLNIQLWHHLSYKDHQITSNDL